MPSFRKLTPSPLEMFGFFHMNIRTAFYFLPSSLFQESKLSSFSFLKAGRRYFQSIALLHLFYSSLLPIGLRLWIRKALFSGGLMALCVMLFFLPP